MLYLCVALLYGLVTPIYEGPDEIGHVLYAKHIAEGRGIPVQSREYAIAYGFGQEGSQSPLYYALNATLVRALGLSLTDVAAVPAMNPFTTCGRPEQGFNVARYRHNPLEEGLPYRGAARSVHVMRLFSAVLGGATVVAVYAAARLAFPQAEAAAPMAAALVAFNPQFALMGGVINNDNLVNCLTATTVALTLYCMRYGFRWWRTLLLGLACGLAPLAKLGGLVALVFAGMGLLLHLSRGLPGDRTEITHGGCRTGSGRRGVDQHHLDWRRQLWRRQLWRHYLLPFIGHASLVVGVFAVIAGWWFARNWLLYGDPTGTSMMLSIYGGRGGWPVHLILPEVRDTFRSYWASFACALRFPGPVYWVFAVLVGLAVAGWARAWKRTDRQSKQTAGLLLLWLGVVTVLWVRWNQITFAPLGRLFFQANAAIAALLGYGLARLTSRPRWTLLAVSACLCTLALTGALVVVRPAFALPDRYPATDPPAPPQTLPSASFADLITVHGYDVSSRSLGPGDTLEVRLYLQATQAVTEDYALALQLLSPVPGDDAALVNLNTMPGRGNYPTYAWQPDEVIVDDYQLQLPDQVARAQAWRIAAIFYRLSDGERLSVTVGDQPAGRALGLGLVRVGASEALEVPLEARMKPAAVFGEVIALQGARLSPAEGALHVDLWWEARAALETDRTVFVHLVDGRGQLVANGDGPPLQGGFPTRMWRPGDRVLDAHVIPLPPDLPPGSYNVAVGLYDPVSGVRLAAIKGGERLLQDAVLVGTWAHP